MLGTILIVLAAVVMIFVIVVACRPAGFRVSRTGAISAPAAAVFAQVNELRRWPAWAPWEKIDPAVARTFRGPTSGVGASYSWAGNKRVGEGRMTIIESLPCELVRIRLEFLKPFKATHTAEFTFTPESDQTVVTWSMFGEHNFMAKAFHLFMDCDKMLGSQFEQGLAQLKSAAAPLEYSPPPPSQPEKAMATGSWERAAR